MASYKSCRNHEIYLLRFNEQFSYNITQNQKVLNRFHYSRYNGKLRSFWIQNKSFLHAEQWQWKILQVEVFNIFSAPKLLESIWLAMFFQWKFQFLIGIVSNIYFGLNSIPLEFIFFRQSKLMTTWNKINKMFTI